MNKTVIIQCDDKGQYAVGEEPADESGAENESDEQNALEPAKDLDDALNKARAILQSSGDAGGGDTGGDADAQFQAGYNQVAGGGQGGAGY